MIEAIKAELEKSSGKLSLEFINSYLQHPKTKVTHKQLTPNTRVCVITLTTGHDLVGFAQVLNAENDVELIGQEVAYKEAAEKIWPTLGAIAKAIGNK